MNNTLGKYLQALAHELRGLPAEQRESELREMRQHLEAIVARLSEGGLSQEEAMEAACAQFGAARKVGRALEQAGSRQEAWWRIALAPVAGASLFLLGCKLVVTPLAGAFNAWVSMSSLVFPAFLFGVSWPLFMAAGAVAGLISPRWGERLLLGLFGAQLLESMLVSGHITGIDFGVLFCGFSGILVGSRWASRRSQTRTEAQRT